MAGGPNSPPAAESERRGGAATWRGEGQRAGGRSGLGGPARPGLRSPPPPVEAKAAAGEEGIGRAPS